MPRCDTIKTALVLFKLDKHTITANRRRNTDACTKWASGSDGDVGSGRPTHKTEKVIRKRLCLCDSRETQNTISNNN